MLVTAVTISLTEFSIIQTEGSPTAKQDQRYEPAHKRRKADFCKAVSEVKDEIFPETAQTEGF